MSHKTHEICVPSDISHYYQMVLLQYRYQIKLLFMWTSALIIQTDFFSSCLEYPVQGESIVKSRHSEFWLPPFQFAPGNWKAKMGEVIIKASL